MDSDKQPHGEILGRDIPTAHMASANAGTGATSVFNRIMTGLERHAQERSFENALFDRMIGLAERAGVPVVASPTGYGALASCSEGLSQQLKDDPEAQAMARKEYTREKRRLRRARGRSEKRADKKDKKGKEDERYDHHSRGRRSRSKRSHSDHPRSSRDERSPLPRNPFPHRLPRATERRTAHERSSGSRGPPSSVALVPAKGAASKGRPTTPTRRTSGHSPGAAAATAIDPQGRVLNVVRSAPEKNQPTARSCSIASSAPPVAQFGEALPGPLLKTTLRATSSDEDEESSRRRRIDDAEQAAERRYVAGTTGSDDEGYGKDWAGYGRDGYKQDEDEDKDKEKEAEEDLKEDEQDYADYEWNESDYQSGKWCKRYGWK